MKYLNRELLNKKFILDCISAFARFYMAYIWISAGVAKLNQHASVAMTIRNYEIFTGAWADGLAHLIGPLEIMGGVLLLLGLFLRQSSVVAVVVLSLFIIGIAQAWGRGLLIDCGCFTINPEDDAMVMNYLRNILRDSFYIFLTIWTMKRPFTKFAIYP
ncbi:MAG: MauE/DoxX family redox-associated membrane protein [Corynebacterium sp.]|nr:MauE/DoxX family redox-associated membrane protein [Corynebacterium sp.]